MASPYLCPITLEYMKDPVLASDGHTYERKAIVHWLKQHGTSPQTRESMSARSLRPNRALKDLIEQSKANGIPLSASSGSNIADVKGARKSFRCMDFFLSKNSKRNVTDGDDGKNNGPQRYDSFKSANSAKSADSFKSVEKQSATELSVTKAVEVQSIPPKAITEELLQSIRASTKATVHINSQNQHQSIVHVDTPDIGQTSGSSHICCVMDISGSMGKEAACKDENGMETRTGLNILDVVKFATLVICKSLEKEDKLSIVTYSNSAEVVLQPTNMDEDGKQKVKAVLKGIKPKAMTNLWDGMKAGIVLANEVGDDYINSVFVLTDGIPNVHPPLGYERSLKRLLKNLPLFGTISTFGFGYSLQSDLLMQIAKDGGGYFSFIPDAGFVGTCFINAVANARSAYGINPYLRIHANLDKNSISSLNNNHSVVKGTSNDKTVCMKFTPLRFGSSIDLFINKISGLRSNVEIDLVFHVVGGQEVCVPVQRITQTDDISDMLQTTRDNFIEKGLHIISISSFNSKNVGAFTPPSNAVSYRGRSSDIDALCKDLEGQANEAISTAEYYERWGRHFLFSLIGAHLHQFCNNFKDPGVQVYGGGELFTTFQEDLNDIFETIPAPEPSNKPPNNNSAFIAPSMGKTFNNMNAVCVHGNTKVAVAVKPKYCEHKGINSQTTKVCISTVKKGDMILTDDGDFATVQCLVETRTMKPLDLVKVHSLLVTPYHPIMDDQNRWVFPINHENAEMIEHAASSVYNLILEERKRHKAIVMDNISCITLGHGILDNSVLKHDYFGSDLIVKDLKKFANDWSFGHVVLCEEEILRKNGTGDICGIKESKTGSIFPSQFCGVTECN